MIEHRSQTMMAHANRTEKLIVSLEKIIRNLNDYLSTGKLNYFSKNQQQTLTHLANEALETQQALENSPKTLDASQIEAKILKIEQHRQNYEKSLGGWGSFFSKNFSVSQQKEKMNETLKTHIAELVIPACGLFDQVGVVDHEYLKKQQQRMNQLKTVQEKQKSHRKK